jgi:hypothetical protein
MAIPSKRKRGQAKAKQLFQRTEDLEEVIARAKLIKKRTLERGKVSLYLFIAGPEGAPYTMSGFQSKMRRTKQRVARKRLAAAGVEKPTKEQLLEAVRGSTSTSTTAARAPSPTPRRAASIPRGSSATPTTARPPAGTTSTAA